MGSPTDSDPTPVRTPPEIKREVLRSRKSSSEAVRRADLAAIEVLRRTGVTYAQDDEDDLIHEISDLLVKHMRDHSSRHNALLQRDVDELSTQLADQRVRATQAVRSSTRLRRAVMDFIDDGDIGRLTRRALDD